MTNMDRYGANGSLVMELCSSGPYNVRLQHTVEPIHPTEFEEETRLGVGKPPVSSSDT